MDDSDTLVRTQLGLLRSRLRKVADNLFQITNGARSIEWPALLEKLNMAVSHLDALTATSATDMDDTGYAEFQPENDSFLTNVLVQPVTVTPDPLTIPSVLLRKRPIPEVEEQYQKILADGYANSTTPGRDEIVRLHDEMLQHDQQLVDVLDWLEVRKNTFNEARKRTNATLLLTRNLISKETS